MNDESRTYHQWQFGRYKMLVGSDAVILNNDGKNSNERVVGESFPNENDCGTPHDMNRDGDRLRTDEKDDKPASACTTLSVRVADVDQLRSRLNQREQDILSTRQSYAEALSLNQKRMDNYCEGEGPDEDGGMVNEEQSNQKMSIR